MTVTMSRKAVINRAELDSALKAALDEYERQHAEARRLEWKKRLFRVCFICAALLAAGHLCHVTELFKVAELTGAALFEWFFFGTAH